MQTEIFEYVRRRKGGRNYKVGVLLGTVDEGTIKIGWSKCNLKEGDEFDSLEGMQMAKNRALNTLTSAPAIPKCLNSQARHFGARCLRYFKDAKNLELPA
jgi:hypothetical protein